MQMRLPGFRDRIVHVRLPDALGGLHLDMTKLKIEQLSGYGAEAGQMILKTFRHDDHIWARYRSTMCMLQRLLERFANSYENPAPQDGAIWPAITDPVTVSPPHYALSLDQHAWTCAETARLVDMAQRWSGSNAFCDRAPHPEPELRAVPRP